MTVRRIVTEERGGRSAIAFDGAAPNNWCDEIWMTTAEDPLGVDPAGHANPLAAPPGSTFFRMVELPPDTTVRDGQGFHRTPTVDYVYVLDGPVELVLDDESVIVQPGDCVVQRSTKHAWRNRGDAPIRLLAVMVGVGAVGSV